MREKQGIRHQLISIHPGAPILIHKIFLLQVGFFC